MASFTSGNRIDWLWGSLKPWQILHSTLAEKERNGASDLDVWELVNETLVANGANSMPREENMVVAEQELGAGDERGASSVSLRFLGDDGEFWKHGGVMEYKVREWLSSRRDEEQELEATLLSFHVQHHHQDQQAMASSELSIAACSSTREALPTFLQRPIYFHDWPICNTSDLELNVAEDWGALYGDGDDVNQASEQISEAETEETSAAVAVNIGDVDEIINEGAELEEDYRDDDYGALISSTDYEYDHDRLNGEYTIVVNRCCRDHGEDAADGFSAGAKLAAALYSEAEENEVDLCAVCLEKLINEEEEEGSVQALGCGHVFHRACIAPWLERRLHACCPCCRAPILDPQPHELHLAAAAGPPPPSATCYGYHHHQPQPVARDIMGLLADMEAALEHLGLRS